jgi:hypothetical protein
LETAHAYIKTLNEEIVALEANIKLAQQGQRPVKSTNNDTYCWSHGYQVYNDHASETCKANKDGHNDVATKDNTMGGSNWGDNDAEGHIS